MATRRKAISLTALLAVTLAFSSTLSAFAATTAAYSDEVGGSGLLARANTSLLNSAWRASVTANGGTAQAPAMLPSGTITSLPVAADGITTTAVTRTRYSTASPPVYVAPSTNQGAGTCIANGATAGAGMQGGAPRPTALIGGGTACPNGFAYAESGGVGENTTRDAVEFTFSRPILGFGAWFGDLETRTDGQGVSAVVRLYGAGNVLISDQVIVPGPTYSPQSSCGGSYTGCGNSTARWVGFVADPAAPVVRMVVIVGDDDPVGDATDEGMSFIGPTFDLSRATISMSKTAAPLIDTNGDGLIGAGDTISYSFLVKNEGTLAVSSVAITDVAAAGLSCPAGSLAPAASRTCTGSHVITQAETNDASVSNTATATAAVYGGSITSAPSTVVTTIPRVSSLTVVNTVDVATYAAVGNVLSYTTTVTNSGNVSLTGVTVTGSAPGAGAISSNCNAVNVTLQPRGTVSCQSSYTVTQQDLDIGIVANTRSTSGTSPTGSAVGLNSATATSTAVQTASLSLTSAVAQPTFDAVGDVLDYTIAVSNFGNVTFSELVIVDAASGSGVYASNCTSVASLLAVGATATCTATYTVTQADLDAGFVTNIADASAKNPAGITSSAPQGAATSTAVVVGGLSISKSFVEATFDAVGDLLTYTLVVTNIGTARATSLVVTDASPGSGAFSTSCGSVTSSLAVNASVQCTATYSVTQADLDAGGVASFASAAAVVGGSPVVSPTARADSTAILRESLLLVSVPNRASFSVVGQVILYALELSNGGNITLASPQIVVANPGAGTFSSQCAAVVGPIAPGGSVVCSASYTVTQADIDAGLVTASSDGTADAPNGDTLIAPLVVVVTPAIQTASLTLTKSVAPPTFDAVGDELSYSLTVTNAGNTTLTAVTFEDNAPGSVTGDCDVVVATLAPGATASCSATYLVTQADLDAGNVTSTASSSSDDPAANRRVSNTATATSLAIQVASFDLAISTGQTVFRAVGDVLIYTITLTNTGNVSLANTTVTNSAPGSGAFSTDCGTVALSLAPGASRVCRSSYTVTVADLAFTSLTNAVSAFAESAGGAVVGEIDTEVSVTRGAPSLAITGSGILAPALFAFTLLILGGLLWRRQLPREKR